MARVIQDRVKTIGEMFAGVGGLDPERIVGLALKVEADEIREGVAPEQVGMVLYHQECCTTTQVAQSLGMSAVALNRKLCEMGVQIKMADCWHLMPKYQGLGLTEERFCLYRTNRDRERASKTMVWTSRGIDFILRILFGE